MTESRNRAAVCNGLYWFHSLANSIRLTRTLLLRKIRQGIRKMYLAPMRGFFYARLGKN